VLGAGSICPEKKGIWAAKGNDKDFLINK